MRAGIVYYNNGERCLVRLCVSIGSLRRVYAGPIAVLAQNGLPEWADVFFRDAGAEIIVFSGLPGVETRTMKASLWRQTPFEVSLFLDADTFVVRDPSELFERIASGEFLATRFSTWTTTKLLMSKRIRQWARILSDIDLEKALQFGPAINTGVCGWRNGAAILPEWERIARIGWSMDCTRRMIDEIACQVLLPRFPHVVVGEEWNLSVRHGAAKNPAIVHYHGNRHTGSQKLCNLWLDEYWALRSKDCPYGHNLIQHHGDRALHDYLRGIKRNDVTVVTVVNPKFLNMLRKNWVGWTKMIGLREQRFIIFAVGGPNLEFLDGVANVTVIPWDRMGDSREACLSAFVFGVAEAVDTPYWMKLDCDARSVRKRFEWPDYRGKTITAHGWGFTRVKADATKRHWLNTLDDWWGETPLFPPALDPIRPVMHARFNSYCSIEQTSFTRRLAAKCGHRLPVPSQDTTAWYVATRWNEPMQMVNMRHFFRQ